MKYVKWALILALVFVASILGSGLYAVGCWLDREGAEIWLEDLGELLKHKIKQDFDR